MRVIRRNVSFLILAHQDAVEQQKFAYPQIPREGNRDFSLYQSACRDDGSIVFRCFSPYQTKIDHDSTNVFSSFRDDGSLVFRCFPVFQRQLEDSEEKKFRFQRPRVPRRNVPVSANFPGSTVEVIQYLSKSMKAYYSSFNVQFSSLSTKKVTEVFIIVQEG